jgi:hypothetical protein
MNEYSFVLVALEKRHFEQEKGEKYDSSYT